MSDVSEAATVDLLVADFANVDGAGKINVIGGGISLLGVQAATLATSPFYLFARITVPPVLAGSETAIELLLEDNAGTPVSVPGPAGEPQIVRVGKSFTFEEPMFMPGSGVPRHLMRPSAQFAIGFPAGLPLPLGQRYVWRAKIDLDSHDSWCEEFYVPGPSTPLVAG